MSFQTHPPNPVADSRLAESGTLQLMVTPASEEYHPRGTHTLPGPVYLSEHILPPLWQNQDYRFTAIYTVTPMKLYVQLHE